MADFLHVLAWNQLAVIPLAAAVWGLGRARLFRERPALRHGLWLLVLLKFVTPALIPVAFLPAVADEQNLTSLRAVADEPNLTSQVPMEEAWATQNVEVARAIPTVENAESQENLTQATNMPSDARHTSRNGPPVVSVLALSLLVSIWLWVAAIRQVRRIRRLLSKSACESGRVVDAAQNVSRCFGLKKEPRLLLVDESISPMLWVESGRLAIVLPRALTMSIDDAQLQHILAHELAHFVRRDHWGNLLSFFVTSLFWWNPIAWLARRELRTAAESCCDAMAIDRLAGSRKSYAETLLTVVDFVTSSKPFQPTVATTFGESRSLKRRIEMIANPNVKTSLSRSGLLLVACGVVSLTLVPARAQQEVPNASGTAAAAPKQPSPGAGSFDASTAQPPGPGGAGSSDDRENWISLLLAVNEMLPGAKTESSPGTEASSESDAQKGIPTILSELANSELPGKSVRAFTRRVHIRRGPETDPGSMTLVLHITLIPADKGDAPLDGKTIHAFLSQWFGNVTARGVKMMEEQIKTAPSDRGNGVDLEVSLTLPPARTPGAETKSFDDYGGGPSAKTKPFDDDIMGRIRANWDKIYIWDAETGSARPCDAGDLGIGLGRLPGMGSAGKTKSSPGAEVGPESDALKTGILTVLKELSADGVHAKVSRVRIQAGPETDTGSMAFVLDITLIPADKGGARVEGKAVVAFLKQWTENVSTRGVTMIVGQIKTEPAGKGNGIDLEIAGTLAAKTNPDRAKAIAQIERIGGKISPEQRELKGAVQWKTSDGGNGHFYKMVAVPEEVTWTEAKRRPIATGGNLVTIASEGITWTEANRRAIAAGGHLVTITSKAENDFVFALVDHPEYWERMDKGPWMMGPWIGGVQAEGAREPDGGWQWVTGEPFAFTNWIPGDPNDNCKASGAVNRICFYHGAHRSRSGLWCDAAINSPYNVSYVIEFDRSGTGGEPEQPSGAISGSPKPATSND